MINAKPLLAGLVMALTLGIGARAQDIDTVVATVNGTDITIAHMIQLRQDLPRDYDQVPAEVLYDAILEQLISQSALANNANTDSKRVRITLENQRRSLLAGEVLNQAVEKEVTEEALRARYETDYVNAEPQVEWNASHILVDTQEEAAEIAKLVRDGADFAETAKERSNGPSGPTGGALNWFGAGRMVPQFEEAVKKMKVGDVSDPVETQFGWHVIKLNETRDAQVPPFEQVASEIAQTMQQEVTTAAVTAANEAANIQRAEIEISPEIINQIELLDQ